MAPIDNEKPLYLVPNYKINVNQESINNRDISLLIHTNRDETILNKRDSKNSICLDSLRKKSDEDKFTNSLLNSKNSFPESNAKKLNSLHADYLLATFNAHLLSINLMRSLTEASITFEKIKSINLFNRKYLSRSYVLYVLRPAVKSVPRFAY